jgi:hypothetical protein
MYAMSALEEHGDTYMPAAHTKNREIYTISVFYKATKRSKYLLTLGAET